MRALSAMARRRATALTALAVAATALVVYLMTIAPDLAWIHAGNDGGDLVTAAYVAGVPHPTGYPVWTMLGFLFTHIPIGSVAFRGNLLSTLAGVGAVALTVLLVKRLAHHRPRWIALVGAANAALVLAFSPTFWGQCVIAEVYSLSVFFVALVFVLLLSWRDGDGSLLLAALAFGLGLGDHVTLVFLGPTALLLLIAGRRHLTLRVFVLSVGAFFAGLATYVYVPIRAATHPVVSWGGANTLAGFEWLVTGAGYHRFLFAFPAAKLWSRLADWAVLTRIQFPVLAWPLLLVGLVALFRHRPWFAAGSVLHALIALVYAAGYDVTDAFVYLLPLYFHMSLWIGMGAVEVLSLSTRLPLQRRARSLLVAAVAIGLVCFGVDSIAVSYGAVDASGDHQAAEYARRSIDLVAPNAVIIARSDAHTFALWYEKYVLHRRPDVSIVNPALMGFTWYRITLKANDPGASWPGLGGPQVTRADLARHYLGVRPVYVAEKEEHGDLRGLRLKKAGDLWRVR